MCKINGSRWTKSDVLGLCRLLRLGVDYKLWSCTFIFFFISAYLACHECHCTAYQCSLGLAKSRCLCTRHCSASNFGEEMQCSRPAFKLYKWKSVDLGCNSAQLKLIAFPFSWKCYIVCAFFKIWGQPSAKLQASSKSRHSRHGEVAYNCKRHNKTFQGV